MSMNSYFERINQIDFLIQKESTGSGDELASRLGVCKATIHNTIKFMKEKMDAPIAYDTMRRTYYYTAQGTILIKFSKSKYLQAAYDILKLVGQFDPNSDKHLIQD